MSMGFSRQEYWSGLPCPSGDIPNPGIEPASLKSPALAGRIFSTSDLGRHSHVCIRRRLKELAIWTHVFWTCAALPADQPLPHPRAAPNPHLSLDHTLGIRALSSSRSLFLLLPTTSEISTFFLFSLLDYSGFKSMIKRFTFSV